MTTNLISLVTQYLTPDVISRIASAVGLDRNSTETATSAVVPALLGGFNKVAATPDGARKLYDTVSKQSPGILDSLTSALGGAGQKSLAGNGLNILSSLFGGSTTQALANAVSRYAGTDQSSASSLLGVLAPVVTGALAKETIGRKLDATGLSQMLSSQKNNIQAAMPSGFADLLRGSGLLGDTVEQARPAATTAQTTGYTAQRPVQRPVPTAPSNNWMYWALPAIVAIGAGWWLFGHRTTAPVAPQVTEQRTTPAPTTTKPATTQPMQSQETTGSITPDDLKARTDQALTTLKGLPGGPEIATQTSSAFDALKTSLSGVTDAATAQTALPKLQEAEAQIEKVRGLAAQLPTGGRGALATLISANLPTINAQLDKIMAMPGVAAILKQPIDALRSDLDTMAKAPA